MNLESRIGTFICMGASGVCGFIAGLIFNFKSRPGYEDGFEQGKRLSKKTDEFIKLINNLRGF